MKKITAIKLLFLLSAVTLYSCEKYDPIDGIPFPTSTPTSQSFYVVPYNVDLTVDTTSADSANAAVQYTWSYINDKGNTVHSYSLQIDSINGNFSNPYIINVSNTVQPFGNFQFNRIALQLNLVPNIGGLLKARLEYLPTSGIPQYSDTIQVFVMPFVPNP